MAIQKIRLRAYTVHTEIASNTSRLPFDILVSELTERNSLGNRRRFLSENSKEADESQILFDYIIGKGSHKYVFGLMGDVVPYDAGADLPVEMLLKDKVKIKEVIKVSNKLLRCKNYYYFYLTPRHLITNFARLSKVNHLEDYLNWLMLNEPDQPHFDFIPMIEQVNQVAPEEIKALQIGENRVSVETDTEPEKQLIDVKKFFNYIFGKIPGFEDLRNKDILEAKLLLKFKKPKNMPDYEYTELMGHALKALHTSDSMKITTKNNQQILGKSIEKVKFVSLKKTAAGVVDELEILKEMQQYVSELKKE